MARIKEFECDRCKKFFAVDKYELRKLKEDFPDSTICCPYCTTMVAK